MKAEEVTAGRLFAGDQQLLIPLWQRRYSWDSTDWKALWRDLLRLESGDAKSHFVGSVVLHSLKWSGLPSEARRYWVVDGQQRITTLTILVCAIRDRIARLMLDDDSRKESSTLYSSQLLINTNLKPEHRFRLVLQEADRGMLQSLIDGTPLSAAGSLVGGAYEFFSAKLAERNQEESEALLTHILLDLNAVWVTLEEQDNAHRVFQTLNAGGKPLRQADLVRNYFFLLLGARGDQFYADRWRILESDLSARELEEFFVAWSVSQGHNGAKGSLFSYFQRDLAQKEELVDAVDEYGQDLVDTARLFRWIRQPEDVPIPEVKQVLTDLRNWGTLPFEGLMIWLFRAHRAERLNDAELRSSLEIILSFVARRMLAGYEPNVHKSIATAITSKLWAAEELDGAQIPLHLRMLLSQGSDVQTWPNDELVLERITSNPLYTGSRSRWVFLILETINRGMFTYANHVPATLDRESFTIEHVMPQTLTPVWEEDLQSWGVASPSRLHATRLHVLGNLTLSPINSQLSNKPFADKVKMLADDWLRLNTDLIQSATWTEARINERSRTLAQAALATFIPPAADVSAGDAEIALIDELLEEDSDSDES